MKAECDARLLVRFDSSLVKDLVGHAIGLEGFNGHLHGKEFGHGTVGEDSHLASFLVGEIHPHFARDALAEAVIPRQSSALGLYSDAAKRDAPKVGSSHLESILCRNVDGSGIAALAEGLTRLASRAESVGRCHDI